jgi:3-oxoacyl-[acyl-carrier-protein] synthase II
MKTGRRTVVITGTGLVTPLGVGAAETFEALCAGRNAIGELPEFKKAGFAVHIGAEVKRAAELMEKYPDARRYASRKLAFILSALDEALAQAGDLDFDNASCGLFLGIETSRISFEKAFEIFKLSSGPDFKVDYKLFGRNCLQLLNKEEIHNKFPFFIPGYIARLHNIKGPIMATSNACASSNYAIGEAFRRIRSGEIDMAVTGSCDEMIDAYILTGFSLLGALSPNNENPSCASRPFDLNRDGFVLGEGGAVLVLEELGRALARGANIICEISGYASTSDAEKITACRPDGGMLKLAMQRAIKDAGLELTDINYVNAHATSTRLNDAGETRAIKSLFGEHAKKIVVGATKSMIGHSVAAAGAIEAVVTAMSIKNDICHPTINLETPDPVCDLDYCPGEARRMAIHGAVSNSCGFSGGNSCVVFNKYGERNE